MTQPSRSIRETAVVRMTLPSVQNSRHLGTVQADPAQFHGATLSPVQDRFDFRPKRAAGWLPIRGVRLKPLGNRSIQTLNEIILALKFEGEVIRTIREGRTRPHDDLRNHTQGRITVRIGKRGAPRQTLE